MNKYICNMSIYLYRMSNILTYNFLSAKIYKYMIWEKLYSVLPHSPLGGGVDRDFELVTVPC